MLEHIATNDNAVQYRHAVIRRVIEDTIANDPYLKPLADDDYPFGYMKPAGPHRPAALFVTYTNMLCRTITRMYGQKIAALIRIHLENRFYLPPPERLHQAMHRVIRTQPGAAEKT